MRNEWEEMELGDLVEIFDGPHATPPKTNNGPIFLGISNLSSGRIDLSSTQHLSNEDYLRWTKRVTPRKDDVVFSYETRLGEAAIIPENLKCCLGRRMGLLRARPGKVHPRFLLFAYLGPHFQETLRKHTVHGSTVDRIPLVEMPRFPVTIPRDIGEQRTIADILGSLDDKIELNRQMNCTLEAMARATFKAWFVDVEPVKAKAAGATSFRGMPQAVFDQLPDRFTDSEVGLAPEGWEVVYLSDLVELIGGGTPKRKMAEYWDGDIPWFSVRDAPNDGDVWVIDTEEKITNAGVENSSAKIMKAGTTIISARGTVGRLALSAVPMSMNQSCYGVTGRNGVGDFFVYFTLRHAVVELQQRSHGSVFDTITRKTFDGLLRTLPQPEMLTAFEEAVAPYLMKMRGNLFENGLLADIRDTLLPKLISGELRVAVAEESADDG